MSLTEKDKLEMLETVLHQLSLAYSCTLDDKMVRHYLDKIDAWSYAHRVGDCISDDERERMIELGYKALAINYNAAHTVQE